jgi:hypothetical protein
MKLKEDGDLGLLMEKNIWEDMLLDMTVILILLPFVVQVIWFHKINH